MTNDNVVQPHNEPAHHDPLTEPLPHEHQEEYKHHEVPGTLAHSTPVHPHGHPQARIIILIEEELEPDDPPDIDQKFRDKAKRKRFVGNVLLALGFQLAVCATLMIVCKQIPSLGKIFRSRIGQTLSWFSMILWFILVVSMGCCNVGRGKPNPSNIALLVLSTLLLSIYTTSITIRYNIFAIMFSAATTTGVVLILVIITLFTKLDITDKMIYIVGAFLALFLFTLISSIAFSLGWLSWDAANRTQTFISAIIAVLYVILILMHLQLIVGGRAYQYEEHDWLMASIMLFFDILMLFLALLGLSRK